MFIYKFIFYNIFLAKPRVLYSGLIAASEMSLANDAVTLTLDDPRNWSCVFSDPYSFITAVWNDFSTPLLTLIYIFFQREKNDNFFIFLNYVVFDSNIQKWLHLRVFLDSFFSIFVKKYSFSHALFFIFAARLVIVYHICISLCKFNDIVWISTISRTFLLFFLYDLIME